MSRRTALGVVAAALLAAPILLQVPMTAGAADRPLWEIGLGAGTLVFNDYRGADTAHAYPLPVPYIVYRGKFFRSGYHGMRGQFLSNRYVDLKLSLDATTPTSSHESDVRGGMPDLQPTFDIGPELDGHLWRSANRRWQVDLELPIRRAITLTSHPSAIGWQAAPSVDLSVFDIAGRSGWNASAGAGPLYADGAYNRYYYQVAKAFATATRPAYRPGGGYAGTETILSTSRRWPKIWVFAFIRYDTLSGASFAASPLVRSRSYFLGGVGFAWMIAVSDRRVSDAD